MPIIFPPDLIEQQLSSVEQAWQLLETKVPQFKKLYRVWLTWFKSQVHHSDHHAVVGDALAISYARMAKRNGSLSLNPRCYHSEQHIEDLLYRLMAISQFQQSEVLPEYAWSLLSLFMCCHDLRQSEDMKNSDLVGNNERASYQELIRILAVVDDKNVIRGDHKQLLKVMIHGSTFVKGEDFKGNIYKGNLVKYLIKDIAYFEEMDKQLAFIACDIDTANVSADLLDYAKSSINVYHEIQSIAPVDISARVFFGELQEQYFFELQQFNSDLGQLVFSQQKSENTPKIKATCEMIKQLDKNLSNTQVVEEYLAYIRTLA